MKQQLLILSCLVFVIGCGQSLKSSLGDFRAYYNTYYNAKESFQQGLNKVNQQSLTIDPNEPVRIHPPPVQAGNADFQKAIEKGAKVLRKFPESKWVDDAILLIGKSYYYRTEFYPALEKFEELRNADATPQMHQNAIIWKGRTQLDLQLYDEAVSYLESELEEYPDNWSATSRAEIQALAGEHYAMMEDWQRAATFLSQAVTGLKQGNKLLGRTLFLYGQTLERLERYGEAYFAFSRVSENFPGFEYLYWARVKQADVARKNNNLDEAISIYQELAKDDKNVERRGKLFFEIARTLEMKGSYREAEERYKQLLYSTQASKAQNIKADIYYRLGKIYSENYNDYATASAYFDSSSSANQSAQLVQAERDAQTLADAFGRYTNLVNEISRADSLLKLGSLSAAQLDSALKEIRKQKIRQLREEEQSQSTTTLANRNISEAESRRLTIFLFLLESIVEAWAF